MRLAAWLLCGTLLVPISGAAQFIGDRSLLGLRRGDQGRAHDDARRDPRPTQASVWAGAGRRQRQRLGRQPRGANGLLPWVRVLLLIRCIASTTWGHAVWPEVKPVLRRALGMRRQIARDG